VGYNIEAQKKKRTGPTHLTDFGNWGGKGGPQGHSRLCEEKGNKEQGRKNQIFNRNKKKKIDWDNDNLKGAKRTGRLRRLN